MDENSLPDEAIREMWEEAEYDPAQELEELKSGRVIFSFPPEGPTRVLIGQRADPIPDTNVVEVNWYLEMTREGEPPVTFCLPRDFDKLWRLLNG